MGYHRAGFQVVGVDINPQPRFPFEFHQADAMTVSLDGFDAIHASPPCQGNLHGLNATNRKLGRTLEHVDMIPAIRAELRKLGVPYVIENVVGSALLAPMQYCGTSFGLPIYRHRRFESNILLMPPMCEHDRQSNAQHWTSWRPKGKYRTARVVQVYGNAGDRAAWGPALGIEWMTPDELTQAIPPDYTEHIGRQLLEHLRMAA
jgi:DNA (cytosine-5)-methyltransferase 1